MTDLPLVPARSELDSLAVEIRQACEDVVTAAAMTLDAAVRSGRILNRVKEMVPEGHWVEWVESNFPFSRMTATRWMRLASNEVAIEGADSQSQALAMLGGMHSETVRGRKGYPPEVRIEVLDRLAAGESVVEVSGSTGISQETIKRWQRLPRQQLDRDRDRRARALLDEQERREAIARAANERGPAFASAYSSLRQHLQALDAAIEGAADPAVKRLLREARNSGQQAEEKIVSALGLS